MGSVVAPSCWPIPSHAGTQAVLDAGVAGQVEDRLAVFLERLPGEDFGEEIGRIVLGADVRDGDEAGAAELAHLEHLAVNVPRVLGGVLVGSLVSPPGVRTFRSVLVVP